MASLIFAQAKSIRKAALKVKNNIPDELDSDYNIVVNPQSHRDAYNRVVEEKRKEFREILEIAKLLHIDYEEVAGRTVVNHYFITIRPREGVTFTEFYALVYKFVNRALITSYQLSFEQKSEAGSGEGFHVHIVANSTARSKGEVLRGAISSFAKVAADNCIDVKPTREPEKIVKNYLIAYKADDGHKEITKNGDSIWRKQLGLADLYSSTENPLEAVLIKSEEDSKEIVRPIVVQWN